MVCGGIAELSLLAAALAATLAQRSTRGLNDPVMLAGDLRRLSLRLTVFYY
jgi:hypothetical protein